MEVPASTRVADLHHMLSLAFATGIRLDAAHILEIDLHFFQRLTERFLVVFNRWIGGEQAKLGEQFPNRTG